MSQKAASLQLKAYLPAWVCDRCLRSEASCERIFRCEDFDSHSFASELLCQRSKEVVARPDLQDPGTLGCRLIVEDFTKRLFSAIDSSLRYESRVAPRPEEIWI